MQKISLLYIELTTKCNSKCKYCNYWKINTNDMNEEVIEIIKTQFKNIEVSNLIFTGGEPLLHSSFKNIVKILKKAISPYICTLMTNGLLLNKYENFISDFFNRVIISIDGFDKESYYKTRGVNGFKQVLNNINSIKKIDKSIDIRIKTTLHPNLISFIPNFIKIAETNKVDKISFNALDTINKNAFYRIDEDSQQVYEKDMIENVIFKLKNNQNTEILFEDIDTLKKTLLRNSQEISVFPKCNALDNTIIIHSTGDIRLCFFTKIIGNLHNNTLTQILKSNKSVELKDKFNSKKLKDCINCVCPYYIKKEGDMPYRA